MLPALFVYITQLFYIGRKQKNQELRVSTDGDINKKEYLYVEISIGVYV